MFSSFRVSQKNRFGKTWNGVNIDIVCIFGWTTPVKTHWLLSTEVPGLNQQSANSAWPPPQVTHSFNPSLPPSSPLRASCKDWISWSHCFCRSWSSSCLLSSQILATPCQCSSWAWHSINCICRSASAPTEGKHRSTSETLLNSLVPVSCTVLFVKIRSQNENRCKTDLHDGALLHSQDGFCQKQINIKRALYVICPMPIEETWHNFFFTSYIDSGLKNLLISQQKNKIIISIPTLFLMHIHTDTHIYVSDIYICIWVVDK